MTKAGKVSLRKIFKRHGAFTALHGIDLDIEPGEFFALLGPSGSGKTTTLRILAGLDEPSEGEVEGMILAVTPEELDLADKYDPIEYRRAKAPLRSGGDA